MIAASDRLGLVLDPQQEHLAVHCRRCGAELRLPRRQPAADITSRFRSFHEAHRQCGAVPGGAAGAPTSTEPV
jgi:hypothetical protein